MKLPNFEKLENYQVGTATMQEVIEDWTGEYLPDVRETYAQPLLDAMAEAKAQYINAYLDLMELHRHVAKKGSEAGEYSARVHGKGLPKFNVDSIKNPDSFIVGSELNSVYFSTTNGETAEGLCARLNISREIVWTEE